MVWVNRDYHTAGGLKLFDIPRRPKNLEKGGLNGKT